MPPSSRHIKGVAARASAVFSASPRVTARGQCGPTPAAAWCPTAQPRWLSSAVCCSSEPRPTAIVTAYTCCFCPSTTATGQKPFLASEPRNVSFMGLLGAEQSEISLGIWHILAFLAIFVFSVTYVYIQFYVSRGKGPTLYNSMDCS